MAPEQAQLKSHPIGRGADIYGLGAILYEVLSGHPPFVGTSAQDTIERVISDSPVPLTRRRRGASLDLEAICSKCLEKDPKDRYANASDLAQDLGRFIDGHPIEARPLSLTQRMSRWLKREPKLAVLGAALGISLLFVAAGGLWLWRQSEATLELAVAVLGTGTKEPMLDQQAQALDTWTESSTLTISGANDRSAELYSRLKDSGKGELAWRVLASSMWDSRSGGASDRMSSTWTAMSRVVGTDKPLNESADFVRLGLEAALGAHRSGNSAASRELIEKFVQDGADQFELQLAAAFCGMSNDIAPSCGDGRLLRRLESLGRSNGVNLLAILSLPGLSVQARSTAAAELMQITEWIDFEGAWMTSAIGHRAALEAAVGRQFPELEESIAVDNLTLIALASARQSLPILDVGTLLDTCSGEERVSMRKSVSEANALRAACVHVASLMMRSRGNLFHALIGAAIAHNVSPGSALEREARDLRRNYAWLLHNGIFERAVFSAGEQVAFSADAIAYGDLEAYQRLLERSDISRTPPKAWVPSNPDLLLFSDERSARPQ